jgi:hypothetical protein
MLFAFDAAGVDEQLAYLVALWVPVLASFALVELLSIRSRARTLSIWTTWRTHEAPVDPRPRPVLAYDLRRARG